VSFSKNDRHPRFASDSFFAFSRAFLWQDSFIATKKHKIHKNPNLSFSVFSLSVFPPPPRYPLVTPEARSA
jgi:hypothetical protein